MAATSSSWTATTGWPRTFTEKLVSAAEAHTADLVIAPFWMVYPENYVEHIRPWEKALQHRAPAKSAPHPGLWLSACRGVHRTGVRKASDPEAEHLLLWQSLQQALPPGSPCRARHPLPAESCLRKISCSTPNTCAMCALPFPSRTSATYYLQCSQSVSHSRVTTADILSAAAAGDGPVQEHLHRTWASTRKPGRHSALPFWRKMSSPSAAGHPTDPFLQAVTGCFRIKNGALL